MGRVPVSRETPSWLPLASRVILGLALIAFIWNMFQIHQGLWDDAYIAFRYAEHLANGLGFIWNVGGERVEGYTSVFQIALLALGIRFGISPEIGSVALGILSTLMTFALMIVLLKRCFHQIHWLVALVLGLYLGDKTTAVHSTSGMETSLFILLLGTAYFVAQSFNQYPRWSNALALSLAVFLSLLCRPEGILYGAALYGVVAVTPAGGGLGSKKQRTKYVFWAASLAVLILLGLIYAGWKIDYFGYLLPNPFYVKSGKLSPEGFLSVLLFLGHTGLWFGPILFIITFGLRKKMRARRGEETKVPRWLWWLTLLPAGVALAYYSTIIHEMGMAYRFSYPTYFYFTLAAAFLVARVVRLGVRGPAWQAGIIAAVVWSLTLGVLQGSFHVSPAPVNEFYTYHMKIAHALQETGLGPRATIICDAAGMIPYYSRFTHVDRVGLTDNFLSGRQVHTAEQREDYLWSRRADVYVGFEPPLESGGQEKGMEGNQETYVSRVLLHRKLVTIEDRIFVQQPELLSRRMKELRDHWYWLGELDWPGWRMWEIKSFVYVRKDSPYAEILRAKLQRIITIPPERVDLTFREGVKPDTGGNGPWGSMRSIWKRLTSH